MMNRLLVAMMFFQSALFGQSGQRIDSSNYYGYVREGGNFGWITKVDAAKVIQEEMGAVGCPAEYMDLGRLIRLDRNTVLALTVACREKVQFGFIYELGHDALVNASDRQFLSEGLKESFTQTEYTITGEVRQQKVGLLPRNIFLLRQRCYWYQFDDKNSSYPVSKDIALMILRQDIRAYLNKMIATQR